MTTGCTNERGGDGGAGARVSIRLRPMNVPEELRYSSDHEWVRRDGDVVRIGITDYAQDALGDVVFVQVPEVGASVAAGDSFGEIESTKSVSDVYAPVSGTVVAVNEALADGPQVLNEDPYGDGWICTIEMSDAAEFDALLDAAAYEALVEG
jgi:glycine cleavage system H protein